MINEILNFFSTAGFMPHGYCLTWNSALLWFHVLSEVLIFVAYMAIPLTMVWIIRRYKNINYKRIFKLFAIFIFSCGVTHFMSVLTVWIPAYRLDTIISFICAIISLYVAFMLAKIAPNIILYTDAYARNLIEASLDPLLTIGPTGKILDLNKSAANILGEDRDELLGSSFYDFCTFPDKIRDDYQHVFSKGEIKDYPVIIKNKRTGEPITILCNAAHYVDEKNEIVSALIAAKDITRLELIERKLIETNAFLDTSERKFHAIFQSSADALILEDDDIFIDCNPSTLSIFGCKDKTDIIGKNIYQFFKQSIDGELLADYCKKTLLGELQRFEWVCMKSDKTEFFADIVMANIVLGYKQLLHISIRDISNTKIYQREIEQHSEQLQKIFMQTVQLITQLNELRDPYTVGHEQRVAELAVAIGKELNLSPAQLTGLHVGGYLHDIGKIGVPIEILSKPGRISNLEMEFIKTHALNGYNILKNIDFPWPVTQIAYQHHERLDGSGYPRGLKGQDIILEARIVAVADVIEAMYSDRPYRASIGVKSALDEISHGRGTIYDTDVVDVALKLFNEKRFIFANSEQLQSTINILK